eukprot:8496383-Alexandrium_andersonii.AAC.1
MADGRCSLSSTRLIRMDTSSRGVHDIPPAPTAQRSYCTWLMVSWLRSRRSRKPWRRNAERAR